MVLVIGPVDLGVMHECDGPDSSDLTAQISAVASLNEPLRRALYEYVPSQAEAVGRDEAAQAVGITRELAAFHLDKLLELGLLDVEFRRLTDRTGPGAGRPAKLYRPSGRQVDITLPERRYELAACLMAEAFEQRGADSVRALDQVAEQFGERLGAEAQTRLGRRPTQAHVLDVASEVLGDNGFDPVQADGEVRLRNCPFHALAKDHLALICGMNLSLVKGVLEGLQAKGIEARLQPEPGMCCVAVGPTRRSRHR